MKSKSIFIALLFCFALTACQTLKEHKQTTGAVTGAVAGGIIGDAIGGNAVGTIIGAGARASAGSENGKNLD